MIQRIKGWAVGNFASRKALLGEKLGIWYEQNPYHKFGVGNVLMLKNRDTLGYGIRPIAIVQKYETVRDQFGESGRYLVTMTTDTSFVPIEDSDGKIVGCRWYDENIIPAGVRRASKSERHFKLNIETDFKRVPFTCSADNAVFLYTSRGVQCMPAYLKQPGEKRQRESFDMGDKSDRFWEK